MERAKSTPLLARWTRWARVAAWLLLVVGVLGVVVLSRMAFFASAPATASDGACAADAGVAHMERDEPSSSEGTDADGAGASDDDPGDDDPTVVVAGWPLAFELRESAPDPASPPYEPLRGLAPTEVTVPPPRA